MLSRSSRQPLPADVKQELTTAPILSSQPVDLKKSQESLKANPQVVTEPPPKPQPSKFSSSSMFVKTKSAHQQASFQSVFQN